MDFDDFLRLARDLKASKIRKGNSILMNEGFVKVDYISKNHENKLAFYDSQGILILTAFPNSEILVGR